MYKGLVSAHMTRNRVAHDGGSAQAKFVKLLEGNGIPANARQGMSVGRYLTDYPMPQQRQIETSSGILPRMKLSPTPLAQHCPEAETRASGAAGAYGDCFPATSSASLPALRVVAPSRYRMLAGKFET